MYYTYGLRPYNTEVVDGSLNMQEGNNLMFDPQMELTMRSVGTLQQAQTALLSADDMHVSVDVIYEYHDRFHYHGRRFLLNY
jgi:hypothetical protein